MVGQFSNCQTFFVWPSSHPRTTSHTLRFNEGFVYRNGDMHKLVREHVPRILHSRLKKLCNSELYFSEALTKYPVKNLIVVISYSRLCPHL
jgi:hypothetical protein